METHQKRKTHIPYTINPNAAKFKRLETLPSFRVNYAFEKINNHLFCLHSWHTFQKSRPGKMNDIVVDPVAPTNDKTKSEIKHLKQNQPNTKYAPIFKSSTI